MDLNSPLYDRVRIRPDEEQVRSRMAPRCQHPGCQEAGQYKAPLGRKHEGQYVMMCLPHVQAYNKSYNYFQGMSDEAIQDFQKDALTGHRPTWKMGQNGARSRARSPEDLEGAADPFNVFNEFTGSRRRRRGPDPAEEVRAEPRKVFNAERKALQVMGLDSDATLEVVKAKYKALVKQHHPDANGGDRSTEDRLIEIIKAYNYLKTVVRS
jgi:curved DNA-binding protein CbpA